MKKAIEILEAEVKEILGQHPVLTAENKKVLPGLFEAIVILKRVR